MKEKIDDIIGQTFGCYKIIGIDTKRDKSGHQLYLGKCIYCDTQTSKRKIWFQRMSSGIPCQHNYIEQENLCVKLINITNTRIRHIFKGMCIRCYHQTSQDYKHYGKKGIKVCREWLENPKTFEDWAFAHGYKSHLSIDRIDENKNYDPNNCRWITPNENVRFKSSTNYITATVTLSGRQWSELTGHGVNYINTMIREHGKEETVKYIEEKLKDKHLIQVADM